MPYHDSIDKVVMVYFASVCSRPFTYKGLRFEPAPLMVSPLLFRGYTCPPLCGGCCPRFTLDYLPSEAPPYPLTPREVEIDDRKVLVFSDLQSDHGEHHCRNLDRSAGRCGIHGRHPFSCDFELIRFIVKREQTVLVQKLFGRGWAMLRVDGQRGARCEMLAPDPHSVAETARKLERLQRWAAHFGIETRLDAILSWIRQGPWDGPLYL
jgi:Fe-S-cluster containining protein